jgi:signal transduction histidine kinase
MSLKLRTRLGYGYAIAIASLLAVLIVTAFAFNVARTETASILDDNIAAIDVSRDLRDQFERMELGKLGYFGTPATRSQGEKRFDAAARTFEERLRESQDAAQTPEEKVFYSEIGTHYGAYLVIDRQIRALIAAGRIDEAYRLWVTDSIRESVSLRRNAEQFYEHNLAESRTARDFEDRVLWTAEFIALLLGVVGIAAAAVSWRRASRDIVLPLQRLQCATALVATERLVQVDDPVADRTLEIAALKDDFNHMVVRLGEIGGRLRDANTTLESQVEERTLALTEANTRLELLVAELQTLDKLKSDFMAVMSHELLTPINFITGFGSALEDGVMGPLTADQREAVAKIMGGAERLTRMVRNTLDYTQLESGQLAFLPEEIDMVEDLEATQERWRDRLRVRDQRLDVAIPDALPPVWADPNRVDQVLDEVLDNAFKFSADGARVLLSAFVAPEYVAIEVADTGPGIPGAALPELFNPFYQADSGSTRRHGGMGLGLSIAHQLVHLMGGELVVRSRLGQGTTVRITLPRADRAPAPAPTRQADRTVT